MDYEQIVVADMQLKQSLAGVAVEEDTSLTASIPVVGQAVLGFVLPWILAMVAIPLELFISTGRYVLGAAVTAVLYIASHAAPDGRVTILMPHPERVFRSVQHSWCPPEWGEEAPWMRLFRNARDWVG